jgi:hypothetical protein
MQPHGSWSATPAFQQPSKCNLRLISLLISDQIELGLVLAQHIPAPAPVLEGKVVTKVTTVIRQRTNQNRCCYRSWWCSYFARNRACFRVMKEKNTHTAVVRGLCAPSPHLCVSYDAIQVLTATPPLLLSRMTSQILTLRGDDWFHRLQHVAPRQHLVRCALLDRNVQPRMRDQ